MQSPLRERGPGGALWFPSGVAVEVQGVRIRGGLIYVGDSKVSGDVEVSLIDRDLRIGKGSGGTVGTKLPVDKPLAYRVLNWGARAAYLHWLAGGRDDRDVEPNFVLIYLSGLERRVLRLSEKIPGRVEELRVIRAEVQRLADRYGFQEFFAGKAAQLLSLLEGKPGSWKVGGEPRAGQKTYQPVNPHWGPVHYGPAPSPPLEKAARVVKPATTSSPPSFGRTVSGSSARPGSVPGEDFLDRERLAKVQAETRDSDELLATIWEGDEAEENLRVPTPTPARPEEDDGGDEDSALEPAVAGLLAELVEQSRWPHGEAKERARVRGLMLDAALVAINEFAVEQCDTELVETEGDLLSIDPEVLEELDLSTLPSQEKPQPSPPPSPTGPSTETAKPPAHTSTPRVLAPRWISKVEIVRVHGRSLTGGMFYYGTPEKGPGRGAVIDPSLPVGEADGERFGAWEKARDYADLSSSARASFLDWLAGGRRLPSVREDFLFLFLQGLEHRVLADLGHDSDARQQLREVFQEVDQLAKDYAYARAFRDQARAFRSVLEWLTMTEREKVTPPSARKYLPHLSEALFLGIGRFTGPSPLPVGWALAWAVHDSRLRPKRLIHKPRSSGCRSTGR